MIPLLAFFCSLSSCYLTFSPEVSVPKKSHSCQSELLQVLKADLSLKYNNNILYEGNSLLYSLLFKDQTMDKVNML